MSVLQAIVLGLVQGFAEFLPVSSSGHLVLARFLLPDAPKPSLAFDVFLHLGTTGAVALVFWSELLPIFRASALLFKPAAWRAAFVSDPAFRMVCLLALSAVPAGVVGLSLRDPISEVDRRPDIVAVLIGVTGVWLLLASVVQRRAERRAAAGGAASGAGAIGVKEALWIGVAQAIAILPGISRSGATLGAGLLLGVRREIVGPFAFLMSIAPILGAALLEARHLGAEEPVSPTALLAGVLTAFVSGVVALKILLPFVRRGRLELFAFYCLIVSPLAYWRLRHAG